MTGKAKASLCGKWESDIEDGFFVYLDFIMIGFECCSFEILQDEGEARGKECRLLILLRDLNRRRSITV